MLKLDSFFSSKTGAGVLFCAGSQFASKLLLMAIPRYLYVFSHRPFKLLPVDWQYCLEKVNDHAFGLGRVHLEKRLSAPIKEIIDDWATALVIVFQQAEYSRVVCVLEDNSVLSAAAIHVCRG